jgi:hypothetical protein
LFQTAFVNLVEALLEEREGEKERDERQVGNQPRVMRMERVLTTY